MIKITNSQDEEESPICQKIKMIKYSEYYSASQYLFKEEVGEKGINLNEI